MKSLTFSNSYMYRDKTELQITIGHLTAGDRNWCTVPNHFFRKLGGLNFLLRCNYDTTHLPQLPIFYRNILKFFKELKIMYRYDQGSDLVLFNNKEILVDNKSVYLSNWVEKRCYLD